MCHNHLTLFYFCYWDKHEFNPHIDYIRRVVLDTMLQKGFLYVLVHGSTT
jgi:hypothetical protein